MEQDEDSITLSMEEYAVLQNDILSIKHENARLKEILDSQEESVKQLRTSNEELLKQNTLLEDSKKIPKFSRDSVFSILKSVRKQDELEKDQLLLAEQLIAIVDHLWPKGGIHDLKISDISETSAVVELKLLKEMNQKIKFQFEGMEEKCKAMEVSLEQTAKENWKMTSKIADLETQKEHLIIDLASREEELGEARTALKEKYAVECSKHELEIELSSLKASYEKLKTEINSDQQQKESQETKILEQTIEEMKNNENMLNLEYTNLKNSAKQTFTELAQSKNTIKEQEKTIKKLEDLIKKSQTELEDMKTERQIIQKRSMHDLKDLKAELAKEKSIHELCKMEKEKVIQENRKLQENLRTGVKLSAPSHQEKIIVESMSNKISELQSQNSDLQRKIQDFSDFIKENQRILAENEELKNENNRLQLDLAMMGAQFNELLRKRL